jgi:hypothetical protein
MNKKAKAFDWALRHGLDPARQLRFGFLVA